MIAVSCPSCQKKLSVRDELAGKRVKCPGCGKPVAVPQPATSLSPQPASREDDRTLPPKSPAGDQGGQPPRRNSVSDAGGLTALGGVKGETTQGAGGDKPSPELYDFLAPAQAADELGRLGPFRVLNVLGAGGMGVVYKAEDPQLKRLVALKAMLPTLGASESARKRFLREAQSAANIVHDHIVPIHQVGEDRGVPFMAMQFLEGEPLDVRLKREGRLDMAEAIRIGREVAEGLAAAHDKGLVHRDIKPGNIWLEGNDERRMMNDERKSASRSSFITHRSSFRRVKILDFGLARAAADDTHLTQTGAIVGTPAYMAPEQAEGKPVDFRCDLFSLGCVLYRMCTGEMPFKGDSTLAIISSLALHNPKPPAKLDSDVPQALSDLVMKLLAKNPAERPESAHAVAEALHEIETSFSGEPKAIKTSGQWAGASGQPMQAGKRKTKQRLLVGGGVLGVAVLGLVVYFLASRERQRPEESLSKTFTNSLGMEFVLVPKGKSWLGGGGGKPGEKEVEIKEDFYLGKYEVTQEEWEKITGLNPSNFKAVAGVAKEEQKRFPVEQVSWDDCQVFIEGLNKRVKEPGWVYRLPTEMEWEYACRGGPMKDKLDSAFDFYFEKPANTLLPDQANFVHGKELKRTSKVGSSKPNKLGLCDMHGNLWEWCDDEQMVAGVSHRVLRGGGWSHTSQFCRAGDRGGPPHPPSARRDFLGLRLARVPVGKEKKLTPQTKQASGFTNALGMEFVLVPKGKSWLGGGGGKPGDKEVEILNDFYLGKYEVTQEEWEKVTGSNPSTFKAVAGVSKEDQKRFPVEQPAWDDCQRFIDRVNKQVKDAGWVYRLPTELEWEYACRGGPLEDKLDSAFAYYLEKPANVLVPNQANFEHGKGLKRTCKVGSYRPNRLGLYDMHGNVWEWCADEGKDAKGNPRRSTRGGGWFDEAKSCRAAVGIPWVLSHRSYGLGLRLARVPIGKEIVRAISPSPKAVKPDESLDGIWLATDLYVSGAQSPKKMIEDRKLIIRGDKYTLYLTDSFGRRTIEGDFKHDPKTNPKTLDFIARKGGLAAGKDQPQRGIYVLEGDTLRFCLAYVNAPRPTKFDSSPKGWSIQVYRRAPVVK